MFSSATKVKGQGVGSAYTELIRLLKKHFADKIQVAVNKCGKADISHYHTVDFKFFLYTFFPGQGKKIGYVHFLPETLEGSLKIPQPFKQIFFWYLIAFYKRMDSLVVVNPSFIKKLERYGISKEKITYIPNFVSKTEFYEFSKEKKFLLRKKYGIESTRFTIIGTGQIQERKGVFDFIELAKRLPQYQFIWVGGFSFGKITDGYAKLKKVVADPPKNLLFPGIVDREKMNDFYNLANVFLLPSFNELFPMSVLEAFSCGIPVVLRNLKLYQAIIEGYYLSGNSVAEFEACLEQLASRPQLLRRFHKESLEAAERYSEKHLASIWYDFYCEQTEMVGHDKKK
ncbi:glycosyltransferase [Liquorilactobacillus oeni DSM 19972]|uniref:Glycosyltransferase n=2 Tax=Liquorilactobacillus oeni TaxID=303241 RepID=A0A0R1MQ66_9LACO|nr:glycosyltransferase [Liquorilactobacillus oeni DSM 19972]